MILNSVKVRMLKNTKSQEIATRLLLVAPLFFLTHAFSWILLRNWTTTLIIQGDALLGTHLIRLSPTSFSVGDHYFQVVVACTSIDALIGSLPLLYDRRTSLLKFFGFFLVYSIIVQFINLSRLVLGFFAFDHGVSWKIAHEIPSGVFLFIWFIWLLHHRGWISFTPRAKTNRKEI